MSGTLLNLLRSVEHSKSSFLEKADKNETSDAINTTPCNFRHILRRFEDKSKITAKLQEGKGSLPSPQVSEFQKLYPQFICNFTKRQFLAMERAFDGADNNQDGFLEPKEVKQLFANHQQQVNLCDADSIVKLRDKNNGKLSPKEFLELCTPAVEALREDHLKGGTPLPTDQDFLYVVLQRVRDRVNPPDKNVQGKRRHFEKIFSGKNATSEDTSQKEKMWQINKFEIKNS